MHTPKKWTNNKNRYVKLTIPPMQAYWTLDCCYDCLQEYVSTALRSCSSPHHSQQHYVTANVNLIKYKIKLN
jgi:hypothetical protein